MAWWLEHTHQVNRVNLIDPMESGRSKSFNNTSLKLFVFPTGTGSLTKTEGVTGYVLLAFLPQCLYFFSPRFDPIPGHMTTD